MLHVDESVGAERKREVIRVLMSYIREQGLDPEDARMAIEVALHAEDQMLEAAARVVSTLPSEDQLVAWSLLSRLMASSAEGLRNAIASRALEKGIAAALQGRERKA